MCMISAQAALASLREETSKSAIAPHTATHGPSVAPGASVSLRGEPSKPSLPTFPEFPKVECMVSGYTCIVAKEQPAGYKKMENKQDCWCKFGGGDAGGSTQTSYSSVMAVLPVIFALDRVN